MRDGGEPHDLAGLFAAPRWLRDFGTSAWLAVGVALLVVATVSILALTRTIVMPVITAAGVAAVASPLVRRFERRGIGAALFLLAVIVLSAAMVALVLGAVTSQLDALRGDLSAAKDTIAGWLTDRSNPLLPRVLVNRIWQHHFGRGLCATPSDFGLMGDSPTHPELLDYLEYDSRDVSFIREHADEFEVLNGSGRAAA